MLDLKEQLERAEYSARMLSHFDSDAVLHAICESLEEHIAWHLAQASQPELGIECDPFCPSCRGLDGGHR
jgi:hypothetical protein